MKKTGIFTLIMLLSLISCNKRDYDNRLKIYIDNSELSYDLTKVGYSEVNHFGTGKWNMTWEIDDKIGVIVADNENKEVIKMGYQPFECTSLTSSYSLFEGNTPSASAYGLYSYYILYPYLQTLNGIATPQSLYFDLPYTYTQNRDTRDVVVSKFPLYSNSAEYFGSGFVKQTMRPLGLFSTIHVLNHLTDQSDLITITKVVVTSENGAPINGKFYPFDTTVSNGNTTMGYESIYSDDNEIEIILSDSEPIVNRTPYINSDDIYAHSQTENGAKICQPIYFVLPYYHSISNASKLEWEIGVTVYFTVGDDDDRIYYKSFEKISLNISDMATPIMADIVYIIEDPYLSLSSGFENNGRENL